DLLPPYEPAAEIERCQDGRAEQGVDPFAVGDRRRRGVSAAQVLEPPGAGRHHHVPEAPAVERGIAGYVMLGVLRCRGDSAWPVSHDDENAVLPYDWAGLIEVEAVGAIGPGQCDFPENIGALLAAPDERQSALVGPALAARPSPAGPRF